MKNCKFMFGSILALILASGGAFAANITVDSVTAMDDSTEATVGWSFTNSAEGVTEIFFDIQFDTADVNPQTTEQEVFPGVFQDVPDGCLTGVTGISNTACILINPTTIRVSLDNSPNPLPNFDTGTITFDLDAGLVIDDVVPLTLRIETLFPGDADVQLTPGSITIVDTDANLTITPASHTFPSQDINDADQTTTFTLENDGETDSLTIGTASVTGAPFSVSDNCDGETLAPAATCTVTVTFAPTTADTFNDTLSVTSDANDVSATLEGTATATANLVVNPPFGPVNLGFGAPGDTLTANGSVQNTGSAAADLSCTLTGDAEISTTPSPLVATIGAGETVNFSLACALPAEAEEGAIFGATLSCNVDGSFAGAHEISCGVSTFEPLPVPTMQAWALALFAMMMLLAGFIGIRFFRA